MAAMSVVTVAVILPPDYKLICIDLDENSYPLGENTAPDRPHGPSNMDYGSGIIRSASTIFINETRFTFAFHRCEGDVEKL